MIVLSLWWEYLYCVGIPIIIRQSHDRILFIVGIPIPVKMVFILKLAPGGRLNKKDGLTRYGDFHVKDKTS